MFWRILDITFLPVVGLANAVRFAIVGDWVNGATAIFVAGLLLTGLVLDRRDAPDLRARRGRGPVDPTDPEWDGADVDVRPPPPRQVEIVRLRSLERVRAAINYERSETWGAQGGIVDP